MKSNRIVQKIFGVLFILMVLGATGCATACTARTSADVKECHEEEEK